MIVETKNVKMKLIEVNLYRKKIMNIAHLQRLLSTAKIKFEKQKSRLTYAAAFVCRKIKIYFSALQLRQLFSAAKLKKKNGLKS